MVPFAPAHQILSTKTAVASHDDSHRRPRAANLLDNLRQLLHRTRRAVDIGWPQLGAQQMLATKDVERQVAVAVVVAVKESAQLMAVDRIIGGVEVEHNLLRWRGMQRQKHLDEKLLDVAMSGNHLLVTALLVGSDRCQF